MFYSSVFILLLGVYGCLGIRVEFGNNNYHGSYGNHGQTKYYNIIGSDYHEGREDIWRPCSLDDYDCMGHFLASNSQCVPAHGCTPDPMNLPIEKFYFPVATMSITHLDAKIRGFKKAKVSEFFINKATGNVVIAITIPTYNLSSNAFFSYQRTAKEPITLNDYNTFEQDNIILTAVIPKIRNLRLDMAEVHADIPIHTPPRYYIGLKAYGSHDPTVKSGFVKFESNIVQLIREASILHSYFLASTFIQKELCDFGMDTYKNYNGYHSFHRSFSRD